MPSYQTSFKIHRVVIEEFTNYSPWVSITTACAENKALLDNTCPFIHGCCHISVNSSTESKYLLSAPLLKSMISVLHNGIYKINKFILLMPPVHIMLSK